MIERWKKDGFLPRMGAQGYITATPGNVIDYDFIMAQVDEDMQAYDLQEIAFDRWGATDRQLIFRSWAGKILWSSLAGVSRV